MKKMLKNGALGLLLVLAMIVSLPATMAADAFSNTGPPMGVRYVLEEDDDK